MTKYEKTIEWDLSKIPDYNDYDFWFFGFETNKGKLLYRKDWKNNTSIFNKSVNKKTIKFCCESSPDYAVIIPHSKSKGWCKRIVIEC